MNFKIIFVAVFATFLGSHFAAADYAADVDASLDNLLGLNCLAEAVLHLNDSASDLSYYIQMCGKDTVKKAVDVNDDVVELTIITNKILNYNKKDCKNGSYKESVDAGSRPTKDCVDLVTRQMKRLDKAITISTTDITATMPSISACGKVALTKHQFDLENFPKIVTVCGELAKTVQ